MFERKKAAQQFWEITAFSQQAKQQLSISHSEKSTYIVTQQNHNQGKFSFPEIHEAQRNSTSTIAIHVINWIHNSGHWSTQVNDPSSSSGFPA